MAEDRNKNIRYSFKAYFIELNNQRLLEVSTRNKTDIDEFVYDLYSIFEAKSDDDEIRVRALQNYSEKIKKGILDFVNKYQARIPQLNAVAAFFRKLNFNDKFFFIPNKELEIADTLEIHDVLRASSEGIEYDELPVKLIDLFGDLIQKYHIGTVGSHRVSIGEKNDRLCRFCNNQRNPTTFKNKAHAISEALGNKTVILLEECDKCNKEFSETIEPDIIQYLGLFRTFYNVKGKGGSKKYIGKNFKMSTGDQVQIKLSGQTNDTIKNEEGLKTKLQSDQPIVSQNVYKSLCKYFLSVIDKKYLHHFKQTIDWINGNTQLKKLPKIANALSNRIFSTQPKLSYYLRKDDDKDLPYAVGVFYFTTMIFVFIVPATDQDDKEFIEQTDFENFWKTFSLFDKIEGWERVDFSSNKPREFIVNLNIKNKEI